MRRAIGLHAAGPAAGRADDRHQLLDRAVEVVVDETVVVLVVQRGFLGRGLQAQAAASSSSAPRAAQPALQRLVGGRQDEHGHRVGVGQAHLGGALDVEVEQQVHAVPLGALVSARAVP